MSPLVVLSVIAQACLFQSVMSQGCGWGPIYQGCGYNQPSLNLAPIAAPIAVSNQGSALLNSVSSASCGNYGGIGEGQVGVVGDIGVAGNTVVVGSVPVLGAVDFSGIVPATGSVSISGQCDCSCPCH